jgi:hypothetical protein
MAIIIYAFQRGDLQEVTKQGVVSLCMRDAFNEQTIEEWQQRIDRKTTVSFDRSQWSGKSKGAMAA